jgi:acetylornithine deacetylase/succinyl-diaminopimelate desuccinylase-like protein
VISGGTQSSVVPAECRIRVGRFVVPGENMDTFLAEIDTLFRRLKAEDPHFDAAANPTYASNAQIIDRDHEVVRGLERAMRVVMGTEPEEVGSQGHSDADFLQNLAGIPCVTFGPRGWGSHKEDEYVELDTVITAARVYAGAVIELLGT